MKKENEELTQQLQQLEQDYEKSLKFDHQEYEKERTKLEEEESKLKEELALLEKESERIKIDI